MHDSFMPLAGMIPMWLIQLGEVIYGGVGSGLYGMIMFAIVAVFIAGLMIGRTPEYLGKKIGAFEIKMASIAILLPPLLVLCGTAIAVMVDAGKAGRRQSGRARLLGNPVRVLVGQQQQRQRVRRPLRQHAVLQHGARHLHAVRALLARDSRCWRSPARSPRRRRVPPSAGTLPTHTPLFVVVLIGTVITVGALTFVPALALGPVVEHLLLFAGQ